MIALLSGELFSKSPTGIIINVAGVGYFVNVPLSTFTRLPENGQHISINIHTHVREDQISLFGFLETCEREMFLRLISISGVGPKLALSILSGINTSELENVIVSENHQRLCLIPGVGKKTAERIVVELKDKFKNQPIKTIGAKHTVYNDALSALTNLGYQRNQVISILNKIKFDEKTTLESLIKNAFKELKK